MPKYDYVYILNETDEPIRINHASLIACPGRLPKTYLDIAPGRPYYIPMAAWISAGRRTTGIVALSVEAATKLCEDEVDGNVEQMFVDIKERLDSDEKLVKIIAPKIIECLCSKPKFLTMLTDKLDELGYLNANTFAEKQAEADKVECRYCGGRYKANGISNHESHCAKNPNIGGEE